MTHFAQRRQRADQEPNLQPEEYMQHTYDVVIAGAGVAGLSAAIELGRRGRRVLVIEPVPDGAYKGPRTYLINNRSMEHLRRWGLADVLRERNPIDPEMVPDVIFATRLNGHELHTFKRPFVGTSREPTSSENAEWTPQRTIESVLTAYARTLPSVTFLWKHKLVDFTASADRVVASIEDRQGGRTQVESQYLIGADGSNSIVRRALCIRMQGVGTILRAFVHHIRAPELKSISKVGLASFYWFVNGSFGGYSGVILNVQGTDGEYSIGCFPSPPGLDPDDREDVRKIIHEAIGQETPIEFISGRSYNMHALVAPSMRKERVFLAGDAAHLLPNLGGFGFNVSLLDGVDIGWKLAHVLAGWGGEPLLASYTDERHEALTWIAKIQIENAEVLSNDLYVPGLEDDSAEGEALRLRAKEIIIREKTQEFHSLGAQKGYRLTRSPVLVDDGSPAAPRHASEYVQSSRPGSLAPHCWLGDASSLYDHFGPEFTLLVTDVTLEASGIAEQLSPHGAPVTIRILAEAAVHALYDHRFTLIRPDQMIAWRGDAIPGDMARVLDTVSGR